MNFAVNSWILKCRYVRFALNSKFKLFLLTKCIFVLMKIYVTTKAFIAHEYTTQQNSFLILNFIHHCQGDGYVSYAFC